MKKQFRTSLKCVLPIFLIAVMLVGCMGLTATDPTSQGSAFTDVTGSFSEQFAQLMKDNFSSSVLETETKYETRTVIVSLSDKSLSDLAGKESISSYAASQAGRQSTEAIHAQQDAFLEKLTQAGIEYELEYRYVAVDNAVALKLDTSYVRQIKKMDGVEKVVLSQTYAVPQTVTTYGSAGSAVTNVTSVYKTGVYDSSAANADGLDGSGIVVAILDTGLDYTHSAFQDMPGGTNANRFTKETVAAILANKDLKAEEMSNGTLTVDDVYYNEKVPFMFDYADKDANVYPSYSNHGTHVAGIVAGHDPNGYTDKDGNHVDEDFWGVAPEAQLAICKVFTDDLESTDLGGAESEDILAALEDCVLLGVDVINMSLGTTCGFSSTNDGDDEGDYMSRVYKAVGEAGISLVVAASNDYSAGFGGVFGTNLATNPDSGTVGSPSTYPNALSVASISGKKSSYLLSNGTDAIFFQDSNDANSNPFDFVGDLLGEETSKTFEYVVIPGVGLASDYTSSIQKLVKGKIAVIKRGDSSFQEKVELAMEFGAIGVIIYNNVSGTVRMSLGDVDDPVPSISVDMKSGELLVSNATNRVGTLEVNVDYQAGPFMSEFSSWGCTGDLKLKPEITAHGGEITSSVPGGYGEQSGTSMASPNMAGVVALMRSYVKSAFPQYAEDSAAINRLVNQLMMSTATTVYDQDNLPYTPRKQGAGLGSLDNARTTDAYLWVDNAANDYRPKIELGDDKEKKGTYELAFYITNFGKTELSFTTQSLFMTETLGVDGRAVAEQAYMLTDVAAQWTVNGESIAEGDSFTVPAGGEYRITVTLALSDAEKNYIDTTFTNGMFVEGFIKLLSGSDGQCDLALPFMGFYGDWSAAPLLDYDVYELAKYEQDSSIADDEKPQASVWATQPYLSYQNGSFTLPMGSFLYLQDENAEQVYADMEHNSISCFDKYYGNESNDTYLTSYRFRGLYAGLLRNARYVDYTLTNADTGEVLESDTIYRVGKAYASAGSTVPAFVKFETDPVELGLVSGEKYTMSFNFYLDYADGEAENDRDNRAVENYTFSFYADYEAPILEDARVRYYEYKDGNKTKQRIYLDLDVYDNHYPQSVMLTYLDSEGDIQTLKMATEYVTPVYNAVKNGTTTVSIEITDIYEKYKDSLYLQVDDYALNHANYWLNLSKANITSYADDGEFELADGEQAIALDIYQTHKVSLKDYTGEANLSNFEWSSNNRAVADVKNGEIVGLSAGTATITARKMVTVTERNEDGSERTVTKVMVKTIEVTVSDQQTKLNIPSISFGPIKSGGDYLTRGAVEIYPGEDFKLDVITDPWYYPTEKLTLKWESTNEKVATVDQQGNVSPLAEGSTVIKAIILVNGQPTAYTATISLRVQDPYVMDGVTLKEYRGLGGVVEIPTDKNVMMIAEGAFENNDTITEIVLPKTVMQIGKEAFKNCTALKAVYFDSREQQPIADCDLSIIYQEAFKGCTALELVDLTNLKVVTLGREVFSGCSSLKEVKAAYKATTLGSYCFADCTSLETIDLTGLYVCGSRAFSGCTDLTEIVTGASTNVGTRAFENCISLKQVTISGPQVGDYAFSGCTALESITFAPEAGQQTVSASIGDHAFSGCRGLKTVTFAAGTQIWSIGDKAFADTGITAFTMPQGLTVLGEDILGGSAVTRITLGDSFDFDAIELMGMLFSDVEVTLESDCTRYVMQDGVIYNRDKTKLLLVLSDTRTVTIPETVTTIGAYAFAGSNVTHVTVPASVKTLGEAAFADSGITALTFAAGSTLQTIPAYAFYGAHLTDITIPETVTAIGAYAFAGSDLYTVTFSGTALTTVEDGAFSDCDRLTEISLPAGIETLGDGLFYGCDQLRSAVIPAVKTMGINTFYGCSKLESVTFGEAALTLGDSREVSLGLNKGSVALQANTFYGCTSLTRVSFGTQITKLDDGLFYGCTALETIDLGNVTWVGDNTFANCTALTTVTGLERLEHIGDYAFYNCNGLRKLELTAAEHIGSYAFAIANDGMAYNEIHIPAARYIGDMAFFGGKELTVTLPKTLEELGYGAFSYSQRLTAFTVEEGNEGFFTEDGVLLRNLPNGDVELSAYPGNRPAQDDTYVVPDGVTRVEAYAFAGLGRKAPLKVELPWSLRVIGVAVFYDSGIKDYTFNSINAPVLATVYRDDVFQLVQNYDCDNMNEQGIYYDNFNTLMFNFTEIVGQESDLSMAYPENGNGYDNYVWTTYFGQRTTLGVLMDDTTREAISAIEALESADTVKTWLNWQLSDENKALVEAFAEQVKTARRLYNNIADETQLAFVSEETARKLTDIESQMRQLKELFGIKLTISDIQYNADYRKNYLEGECFDITGLVLTIVYDDYSTEVVDLSRVTYPTGALTIYDWDVTLEYRDGDTVESVKIPVSVKANAGTSTDPVQPDPKPDDTKPTEPTATAPSAVTPSGDSNGTPAVIIVAVIVAAAGIAAAVIVLHRKKRAPKPGEAEHSEKMERETVSKKERKPLNPTVKWLIVAVVCVLAIVALCLLSGGEEKDALADVAAQICYYANGGEFADNKSVKTIGYKTGSYPLDIQHKNNISKGNVAISERDGYIFQGWYLPELDANGNVVYEDEAKTQVKLGQAYDFSQRLADGADISLYAKWQKAEYVSVVLCGDAVTDKQGNAYAVGDELKELYFQDGMVQKMSGNRLLSMQRGAYTFVEYYEDAACTKTVSWPIRSNGTGNQTIYAKFIEGDWEIVTNKSEAASMLSALNADKQYYLICDIDLDGQSISTAANIKATVEGNGFTLSNFVVEKKNIEGVDSAMLGAATASATIRDLTLEQVTFRVTVKSGTPNLYFLFTAVDSDARISGLTVRGEMTVGHPESVYINNIQPNAHESWIVGEGQSILTEGEVTVEVTCRIGDETYEYPLTQG